MSSQNERSGAGAQSFPFNSTTTTTTTTHSHFQIIQQTIHNLIGITPAGTYCLLCNKPFQPHTWRHHFNTKHPAIAATLPNRLDSIIQILNHLVKEAATNGNIWSYAKSNRLYNRVQCGGCSSIFRDSFNIQQHYDSTRNKCSASTHPPSGIKCIQLNCGRFYPAPNPNQAEQQLVVTANTTNNAAQQIIRPTQQTTAPPQYAAALLPTQAQITQNPALQFAQYFAAGLLPANITVPVDVVDAVLVQLIDQGDTTDDWHKIFFKYIATSNNFILGRKADLKSDSLDPRMVLSDTNNNPMARLMDLFIYLESHTKMIANGTPANWKAALVKFVIPTDDNEDSEGAGAANMWTFRYRNNPSHQLREFMHLLCYLRHHNCPFLYKYIELVSRPDYSHDSAASACIISNLLYELAAEQSPDGDYIPWICRFSLYRCLQLDRESDLPKLKASSVCGKIFATVLYMLRQGIIACAATMTHGGYGDRVLPMLKAIQPS